VNKKLKVGIVFGGRSAEHQVSLQSAKSIINAINSDKYEPVLIAINKEGKWLLNESTNFLVNSNDPSTIQLEQNSNQVALVASEKRGEVIQVNNSTNIAALDVLFPVLHGPYGEDGSIQGLAKLANIPCVGSGILGSAVGMDKDFTKRLLKLAGIAVADYIVIKAGNVSEGDIEQIETRLEYPVFVKPANMGSSIGVNRADSKQALLDAIKLASQYDHKILIEETINGREIECAVLGNDDPEMSVPGEIVSANTFYDYKSKYINEDGASLSIPAKVDAQTCQRIQDISKLVFQTLECKGLARVDVFLTDDGQIFVNEVNTIPGFTKISMYPKLWEHSGINYPDLIDRLIQLAIREFETNANYKTE